MLEWALLLVTGGQAEVVAMKKTELECWETGLQHEAKEGEKFGCFKLVTQIETREEEAAPEQ